jgi:DNA topoisomerase-1
LFRFGYAGRMTAMQELTELYQDSQTCAKLIGLNYIAGGEAGIARQKHSKGWMYKDASGKPVSNARLKKQLAELVIPPAWQEVWICPSNKGHILATGIDDKGRKQYIYHPKWRTMRDLIKFYRMIVFAGTLPKIRRSIGRSLKLPGLPCEKVISAMLWILDNTYIRIGNDIYFNENESVGLTTLTDKNIVIAGPVVTLNFKGKSGKDQQITFEDKQVAGILDELRQVKGARLFRYKDEAGQWQEITSDNLNAYLHELAGAEITAKDFRTWGGTLTAFMHLLEEQQAQDKKSEKAVVAAVDQAAAVLGNTRAVAKSSYVHPDLLNAYGSRDFKKYYERSKRRRRVNGLEKRETELLAFLEQLFENEFDLLKQAKLQDFP